MQLLHQIGKGAQADIFLENGFIYKAFRSANRKTDAFWEATVTTIAEDAGLPVARIHEVLSNDGKPVLKMDYIQGETLLDLMIKEPENLHTHVDRLIKLQNTVHAAQANLPLYLKDVMEQKISGTRKLNEAQKSGLIVKLKGLPDGNCFCHGDFHGYNIICAENGDYIIDWLNAATGCKYADVCYTYMLYALYFKEVSKIYLETYCRFQNIEKEKILEWLPVIAAVRLDDNNPNDYDQLMSWVDQIF